MADAPFTPPRKKPSIFWWIGGAFLLLVLLFLFQLFGPNPRIIISPQTTHITGPLRPDGTPDYIHYELDKLRDGVTPENNAATLLWPAVWGNELDPADYAAVTAELGLSAIPSKEDAIVPVDTQINKWLKSQSSNSGQVGSGETNNEPDDDAIFNQVTTRPWTSGQFPWLAEWVKDNKQPLDQMVAGSKRPRCYIPSPTTLSTQNGAICTLLLPGQQSMRETGRSLVTRAMWNVGENRPIDAWRDLLAIRRIGRIVAKGPTIIDELVGISIDGVGNDGTIAMLDHSKLTPAEARQIMKDLDSLQPFSNFADSIDNMERMMFLDTVIQFSNKDMDSRSLALMGVGNQINWVRNLRIDWNIVLRKGNDVYDRMAAAARLATFDAREQAFADINRDIQKMVVIYPGRIVGSTIDVSARSDVVATSMLGLFIPALDAASSAQDRANTLLDLTRLAAALAVYRTEHDKYPEKLDDLVPGMLATLPVDLYHAKPFIYKRTADGYLLYTTGPNGSDDGGSSQILNLLEGNRVDTLDPDAAQAARDKIPAGSDDIAIRVPLPPINIPKPTVP